MTGVSSMRRGWCPSALRPMETGDGWLVRVRPRAGAYTLDQLCAIADAAASCGNSAIDLTNRANLQIRGLTPDTIEKAQSILSDAGLIDGDPAVEAIRNVIVSPFAGLDPSAFDIRSLAVSLEAALSRDMRLRALPGKFGFALDGGGRFPLAVGIADIVLRAANSALHIELGGEAGISVAVDEKIAVETMVKLAHVFTDHARIRPSMRRMRDLVNCMGALTIYKLAGLEPIKRQYASQSGPPAPIGPLGAPDAWWGLSIGLPYGRITSEALSDLVDAARTSGVPEFRPSASRTLITPLQGRAAPLMVQSALKSSLIVTSGDPRLLMDVCPGAPACGRGTTSTRSDADEIAAALRTVSQSVRSVHVSGCVKGCARAAPAAFTFVARDGQYGLIRDGNTGGDALQTGMNGADLKEAILSSLGGGCA